VEQQQIPLGCHLFFLQNLFSVFYGIFSFSLAPFTIEDKNQHNSGWKGTLQVIRSLLHQSRVSFTSTEETHIQTTITKNTNKKHPQPNPNKG